MRAWPQESLLEQGGVLVWVFLICEAAAVAAADIAFLKKSLRVI